MVIERICQAYPSLTPLTAMDCDAAILRHMEIVAMLTPDAEGNENR